MSRARFRILCAAMLLAALPCLASGTARAAAAGDLWKPAKIEHEPAAKGGYVLTPALTFGGANAPDEAQFFEKTGGVQVDSDAKGNVYVLDNGNNRIQVFDAQGTFVRTIGGEGQGPGEFQLPHHLCVNAPGQVAVYDMGQQRLSIFEPTGKLRRDQVVEGVVHDLDLLDDGGILVAHEEARPAALERFDANGNLVWQFAKATEEERGGRHMSLRLSRSIAPLLVALPGSIFNASSDAYCIRSFSSDGQARSSFARAYDRQRMELPNMNPSEGEEGDGRRPRMVMVTRTEEADPQGGSHAETNVRTGKEATITLDAADLAKMLPEFSQDLVGLLAWPDGRLWAITSLSNDDRMVVDEWSSDGKYLKRFELPGAYDRLRVGSDGQLYGVGHDDEEFAVVYRLTVASN